MPLYEGITQLNANVKTEQLKSIIQTKNLVTQIFMVFMWSVSIQCPWH